MRKGIFLIVGLVVGLNSVQAANTPEKMALEPRAYFDGADQAPKGERGLRVQLNRNANLPVILPPESHSGRTYSFVKEPKKKEKFNPNTYIWTGAGIAAFILGAIGAALGGWPLALGGVLGGITMGGLIGNCVAAKLNKPYRVSRSQGQFYSKSKRRMGRLRMRRHTWRRK